MRLVNINEIPENSIIARAVYTSSGGMLINERTPVTDKVVRALRNQDIHSVYVTDALTEQIKEEMQLEDVFDLRDVIDPVLRRKINVELKDSIVSFKKAKGLSTYSAEGENLLKHVSDISNTIVSELMLRKDRSVTLIDVKHLDIYDFEHAVNTAILSVIVGLSMGLSERELLNMSQGALLMNISNELLEPFINKDIHLSLNDKNIMQSHPEISRQLLNDNTQANAFIKNIVLKHHERMEIGRAHV